MQVVLAEFADVALLVGHRSAENTPETQWFAAYVGGELAGCCAAQRFTDQPAIALFFAGRVVPKFRRRGVYRELCRCREEWCRLNGIDFAYAACNAGSLPQFERNGFSRCRQWPGHLPVVKDLR